MDGNRDEADRCIEIALSSINSGKYEKAEKFLRKAENLFPSQKAKELLKHVRAMAGTDNSTNKGENVRERKTAKTENPETPPSQSDATNTDYSQQQIEIVRKIKKCKDYYEVLGITKEATDSEIRKAYKKLALQLHPDKNRAPGAAEAFKAIGNAVAVLTDVRKRKEYDLFGGSHLEEDRAYKNGNSHFSHHAHNRRTDANNFEYTYTRGFESDISAEELFNMFFGGFPQDRFNRERFTNQNRRESNQQPSLAFGLILVLVVISMMSSFFTSDPLYSLAHTSKYTIQRRTGHLGVTYYVKENFVDEYQGSLARLENSVEEDYLATMKQNCYRERSYRDSMIARAKSFGSRSQVAQAQALKVPSCDNLVKLGLTRYSYY